MTENSFAWFNGALVPSVEIRIDPHDRGFLIGEGVFETLRSYSGEPFAVARHLQRLAAAAAVFRLPLPEEEVLGDAIRAVLTANQLAEKGTDARIRITATAGNARWSEKMAEKRQMRSTVLVTAELLQPVRSPANVLVVPFQRNPRSAISGIKTTSYAENALALRYARERHFDEAILANTLGDLCEGATSNVFVISDGRLLTPPLDTGCLPGITRELVLEVARKTGIDVQEKRVPVAFLERCEGAFLTSSVRELQPVTAVGNVHLSPCEDFCAALAIR
jgi:branched-chain amino acid aminotransferase